jgi:predicted RNA binding protein YcfA (HicA-like mRNA interferase family)
MAKLPNVSGNKAIKAFARLGFRLDRVNGSHHVLKKEGHPYHLSVPVHGNKAIRKGTLRALILDAGVSVEQFVANL